MSDDRSLTRPTSIRWFVLAIVAFASASAYLTRYCISAANTSIQANLKLDDAEMGQLMSAFALGYLLFQVPGGWLGNHFGTRLAFPLISVCWSLCNVFSAISAGFAALWAARFGLGAFQAGLVPVSGKIIGDWIPLRGRGLSSALITAAMSIGAAFSMWLTGRLLSAGHSWQIIFHSYAAVGIVWAIGFAWYFRTSPSDHRSVNAAELELIHGDRRSSADRPATGHDTAGNPATGDLPTGTTGRHAEREHHEASPAPHDRTGAEVVFAMLRSRGMWGICLQSYFRAAGYAFFVTWFFAFLEYAYGIDKAQAGLLNSLPLIAFVMGSLAGGALIDGLLRRTGSRLISRTGTAILSLGFSGLLTALAAWTSTAQQLSTVIAIGAFFSGLGAPAAWAATIDMGGRHTALAMGVMNMAGCLAGVMLPTALGEWFQHIRATDGNWNLVIYLHAAFYFAGAACWLVVDPNREV